MGESSKTSKQMNKDNDTHNNAQEFLVIYMNVLNGSQVFLPSLGNLHILIAENV